MLPLKKIKQLPSALAEKMELPGELLPGAASLILTGGKQALVEGHRGIVEYSQEQIVLALKRGKLILSGSQNKLNRL